MLRAYCVAPRITIVEPHNSGGLLRKCVAQGGVRVGGAADLLAIGASLIVRVPLTRDRKSDLPTLGASFTGVFETPVKWIAVCGMRRPPGH